MSEPTPEIEYARSDTPQPWTVSVGFVALRVMGIYLVVSIINAVIFTSDMLWRVAVNEGMSADFIRTLLGLVAPVLTGSLLVLFAKPISVRLFDLPGVMPAKIDAAGAVSLGAVVIGLWTMVQAIPSLLPEIFSTIEVARAGLDGSSQGWFARHWWLAVYSLQFLVGLFLFLRPGWVVGQFRKRSRV